MSDGIYCTDLVVARGKEPRHGTDAYIKYYFNTDVHAQPTLKDDGTVDYFHLNMINPCKKGQLLAEVIPEDERVRNYRTGCQDPAQTGEKSPSGVRS